MMNFFNLTLSEKHLILPSILNDSFAGYSNLGCRLLPFMTWNTSCQPLLACKVSLEKSADKQLEQEQGSLCSLKLVFWVPSGIFPGVGLLSQKADPFLIFWGISILPSTVAAPVCIPTNSAKGFPFLHILTTLVVCWFTDDSHLWQVWDGISLWFLFAFLWWLVMLSIF